MQMYIVLAIAAFMVVMFLWNKFPFGVITMTSCVLLVLTGVIDISTAFSGFSNNTVVLIAPMLALSAALTKTSIVPMIRRSMSNMRDKGGMVLVAFLFLVVIAFVQFIPATATFSILIVFMVALDDKGEVTPYRLLLPMLGISCIWKSRLPIGMGAANFARYNALCDGIITDENLLLKMLDPFYVAILPTIVLTIYCLFAWKLLPKEGSINTTGLREVKETQSTLTKGQETLIYVVFVAVMLVLVLNKWTGNYMYIAPAVGVLVLVYARVLTVPETVKAMTSDMIWMIAGVLTVASALGSSGAGDLIGNSLLNLFSATPNSFVVMLVFAAVTIVMTIFLSNTATYNILTPVAAMICAAGGWDPRGLLCIIAIGNTLAIAFPSGAAECAVVFAAGGYNPGKVLKFTLPYILLAVVSLAFSANMIFPLY